MDKIADKTTSIDYDNTYEVKSYVRNKLVPLIMDELINAYGYKTKDHDEDCTSDYLHEIIDGLQDVIYTYKAKKISEAYKLCPFEDENRMTGERYKSYSEMAYDVILDEFLISNPLH